MRKTMFRGKTEEGSWVYGYLFVLGEGTEYAETYILGHLDHRDSVYDVWKCATKVISKTVGQDTGMFDTDGVRIFEGDVFNYADTIDYTVIWHDGRVGFYADDGNDLCLDSDYLGNFYSGYCKVIGNIHDNPELLHKN